MKNCYLILFLIALNGILAIDQRPQIINKIFSSFIDGSPKDLFKVWHLLYKKSYTFDTQEARDRFKIFKENLKFIKEHNSKNLGYKLGLNQFSDMTNKEYKEKMCTKKVIQGAEFDKLVSNSKFIPYKGDDDDDDLTKRRFLSKAIENIDYTGYFNEPRDQGSCGSCWAFATVGAVEGALSLKYRQTSNYLSPQQLVDCDSGNNGCNGGNSVNSYDYVSKNGVHYESIYPYTGNVETCKYSNSLPLNRITSFSFCSNYSSNTDKSCSIDKVYSLLQQGPGTIGIDASSDEFRSYSSGIFSAACSADNHAVILVGAGTTEDGIDYWLVRNSWGTSWGDKGYIKVKIDDSNSKSCFVNNEIFVPIA